MISYRKSLPIIFLFLLVNCFTLLNIKATGKEPYSPWKFLFQSEVKFEVRCAGFLDRSFGIAAGCDGKIQFTEDGGKTWRPGYNYSLCRYGLDIVDRKTVWQCGDGDQIGVTNDHGKSWRYVTAYGFKAPEHCRFLSFSDPKNGWIASPAKMAATADGGQKWTELILPEKVQKIAAIFRQNTKHGYLLDNKGFLFTTENAGATWTGHTLGLQKEELPINNSPLAAIRFSDPNHGIIVLYRANRQIWAYRTGDGGKNWQSEQVPTKRGGFIYLARDGRTLTITTLQRRLSVFWRQ